MHLFIYPHFNCILFSYVSFNHGRPTENCLSLLVIFLLDCSQGDAYFVDYLCVFRVCLLYTVSSVPCSLVATCWERAALMFLLCVMFYCVFVTFPYGVLGQVWYLVVSIPDLCLLPYFNDIKVLQKKN